MSSPSSPDTPQELGQGGRLQSANTGQVLIRLHGEMLDWVREMLPLLSNATTESEVVGIAIELLHSAKGKEIRIGSGRDSETYNPWR